MPAPRSALEADLLRAGRPFVSNVFFGPLIKQHVVALVEPVLQNGEFRYSVAAGVPLTKFVEILETLKFSLDQLVTVIDRSGIIVTRSERHNEFAGTQVKAALPLEIEHVGRSRTGRALHFIGTIANPT